jgi:hypothetical protein
LGRMIAIMTTTTKSPSATAISDELRLSAPLAAVAPQDPAMNALKAGFTAEALLLPGESRELYAGTVSTWMESLRPANGAEGRLISRVADIDFRLQRLARVERKQVLAAVDLAVKESEPAKLADEQRKLKSLVAGLAQAVEGSSLIARPEALQGLLPAIGSVIDQLVLMRLPGDATGVMFRAKRSLAEDNLEGEELEARWKELGAAAREVESEFDKKIVEFEAEVERERERLLEEHALGDDREAKRLERHRGALQREMDQVLATLKTTRELAAHSANPAQAPFCGPLRVDLRILPATSRHGRSDVPDVALAAVRVK